MCFISSSEILVPGDSIPGPSGIEPGTFGVTATNVTVSNNGPRSQLKSGQSGALAFFFPTDNFFFLRTDKNFMFQRPPFFPLRPRGLFLSFSVSIWLFSFFCFPPGQCGFGQFWRKKLVLVEFGQEKWFWSLFAGKTGF